MNIYLVHRKGEVEYDEFRAHVVVAADAASARRMCAEAHADEGEDPWLRPGRRSTGSTVQLIGTAEAVMEPGLVLSDFKAG